MSARDHYVALAESLSGVERVLDAPAGDGRVSASLASGGLEIVCADLEPARFAASDLSVDRVDLNGALPYDDASFDLVLCREGIEHVESHFHTLREFHRILRPGGWLLISTPNLLSLGARLSNLLVGGERLRFRPPRDEWPHAGADHIHVATYYSLRAVLHRSGFKIERVATHRMSRNAIALAPLVPLVALATSLALARERDPAQREANREIRRHVLSRPLLYGKKLILVARRSDLLST